MFSIQVPSGNKMANESGKNKKLIVVQRSRDGIKVLIEQNKLVKSTEERIK